MRPKPPPKYRILVMMATNMPEALDEALLRPGRIDRIYKVGYPSKAGRDPHLPGLLRQGRHELTPEDDRQAGHDHAVRHRRHHQGPGQRVADHRDPRRPRRHHLARRDEGQAAQGARPARGRRVHRARAARRRRARGLPRGRRLPHPAPHGDRHRHHREGQRLPRHGGQHPAGGPVHPVADGVRDRHPRVAGLAGRGADVLRRATTRPGVSGDLESATAVAAFMEGFWGMGIDRLVATDGTAARGRHARAGSPASARAEDEAEMPRAPWPTGSRTSSPTCWSEAERDPQGQPQRVLALAARAGDAQDADRRGRRGGDRRAARPDRRRQHLRRAGVRRAAGGVPRRRGRRAPQPRRGAGRDAHGPLRSFGRIAAVERRGRVGPTRVSGQANGSDPAG